MTAADARTVHPVVEMLVAVFVLPLLALGLMTLMRVGIMSEHIKTVMEDLGWDMTVLGVGIASGVLGNAYLAARLGATYVGFGTAGLLLVDLILAAVVLLLRKSSTIQRRTVRSW